MEKFNSIFAAMLAIAMGACSNEDLVLENVDNHAAQTCETTQVLRTPEEAVEIANQVAGLFDEVNSRSSSRMASIRGNSVMVLGNNHASRSAALSDTLLYVVSYDDAEGYAIIAAPANMDPLIGIVEKGEFVDAQTATNESFQFFLNAAMNKAETYATSSVPPIVIKPAYTERTELVNERIEPKVKVEWGQGFPEGYFCPNKISGCVQTATVQIMSVFEEPKSLELTYPNRDKDLQMLYWPQTKSHVQSSKLLYNDEINAHLDSCSASSFVHYGLARLCREIGYRNNANYYTSSTGVSISRIYDRQTVKQRYNLKSLLPSRSVSGFKLLWDYDALYNDLKDGVVMINGIDDNVGGHAWVADGAVRTGTITYITYTSEIDPSTGKNLVEVRKNIKTIFHFNWGWNGSNNGYFDAGVFDPGSPSKYAPVVSLKPADPDPGVDFGDYVEYCVIK